MRGWEYMQKLLLIVVLVVLVLAGTAEAASKATLSIYPKNVNVAPRARIQFSVLLKKDGLVSHPSRVKITGPASKKLKPTLFRMPEKPGTYKYTATAQGLSDTARITVKNVAPAGKRRDIRPSIRILKITKKLSGKLPRSKSFTATVKVSGLNVHDIVVEALNRKLEKVEKRICGHNYCKHGQTVSVKGTYPGVKTKFLRFSLRNSSGRVLFKKVIPD